MLSDDKHCEILAAGIRDKSSAMYDGFKLFVQLFSGIVGGSILLRLQYRDQMPSKFVELSDFLVVFVVVTGAIIIGDNFRSLWEYRETLSKSAGNRAGKPVIPRPDICWSGVTFFTMLGVMVLALIGFICFNPLQI